MMTPAELRTAHDSLGISTELLAERAGYSVQMIWRYESPSRTEPVPERVEEAVRDMLNDFTVATERIAAEVIESGEAIPRYTSTEAADAAVPELAGWGARSHGLLVAAVLREINAAPHATDAPIQYV